MIFCQHKEKHGVGLHPHLRGFSLVEVVLALAVFTFVMVSLVGLISVGVDSNRESIATVEATNLAQSYFAIRRAAPLAETIGHCPIPRLDQKMEVPLSSPLYVKEDGTVVGDPKEARFALAYSVTPPTPPHRCTLVHVILFWPASATYTNASGFYETTASFLLR